MKRTSFIKYLNKEYDEIFHYVPQRRNKYEYGSKIRTEKKIRIKGETRWRRVYAICYSNVASHYVIVNGEKLYLK